MTTFRHLAAAATTALALGVSMLGVAGVDPASAAPRRIPLPNNWQPEGITTDGSALYIGSLRAGGIWKADPRTGVGRRLAPGRPGRTAVGMDYDRRRDLLWVAGGATGVVRAQDPHTGRIVRRYSFGSGRFLNDLTVTRRGVFITDSANPVLAVIPMRPHRLALPPARAARTMALRGQYEHVPDAFNLNGIVNEGGVLLAVQTVNGHLYRIGTRTGFARRVDVRRANLVNADGLRRHAGVLYAVRNQNNRVVALDVNRRLTRAVGIDTITAPSLDVPTGAAVARGFLWAVNARFGPPPSPTTRYWVSRLRLAHR